MNDLEILLTVAALASATFAGVALIFARQAGESAGRSAVASEKSATSSEQSTKIQERQFNLSSRAYFVPVDHNIRATRVESEPHLIEFRMEFRNEGGSNAHSPYMYMRLHETSTQVNGGSPSSKYHEDTHLRVESGTWRIKPGEIAEFKQKVHITWVGQAPARRVSFILNWRDIVGNHVQRMEYIHFGHGSDWPENGARSLRKVVLDLQVITDTSDKFPEVDFSTTDTDFREPPPLPLGDFIGLEKLG